MTSTPDTQKKGHNISDRVHNDTLKIPHKIKDVCTQIMKHPNYTNLDMMIKFQVEGFDQYPFDNSYHDNKWLRLLWKHLYTGGRLPY